MKKSARDGRTEKQVTVQLPAYLVEECGKCGGVAKVIEHYLNGEEETFEHAWRRHGGKAFVAMEGHTPLVERDGPKPGQTAVLALDGQGRVTVWTADGFHWPTRRETLRIVDEWQRNHDCALFIEEGFAPWLASFTNERRRPARRA
ncbi:MAG TPA: hypothetical protein PKM43_21840 [Verrucomicrobiota bacterium]|nr:hypothetical protein [Verrucomicrobiota bacterium]